jgi:large subunit ribosomal protein L4
MAGNITLKRIDGTDAGSIELPSDVFDAPLNEVLVREALNAFLGNQRQGTHSTKTRGMVRGGGKKPWKQKHTGRARAGSSRSPLWRGGAIIFGPSPRDYRQKFNAKKRKAALRAVLSSCREDNTLTVLENLDLAADTKTKNVVALIEKLDLPGRVLIVTDSVNDTLFRCSRNVPWIMVRPVCELNFYDVLVADSVVFTRAAVDALQEAEQ